MRLGIFRQLIDRQFSKVPPPRLRWQQLIPPSVPPESHVILLKIVHPILPPPPPAVNGTYLLVSQIILGLMCFN